METMQEQEDVRVSLVRQMVMALVDEQDEVDIQSTSRDGLVTVHVTVAKSDVGKVIGKQGRTARSMRCILACASMKTKTKCDLNILEYAHGRERKAGAA